MADSQPKNDKAVKPATLEPGDEKNIMGRSFITFTGTLIILLLLYVLFFALHK